MSHIVVPGACLCGAVAFELELPTKWIAHCHCSMCRRAHGAPYVTWVGMVSEQVRVTSGSEHLERYRSSPGGGRCFCRLCGSSLFFEHERWAGETHVALANMLGELDREPQVHAFFSDKAPWVHVDDGLPRRGGVTGTEPLD